MQLRTASPRKEVYGRPQNHCAQCGDIIFLPEWSEYLDRHRVRHLWAARRAATSLRPSSLSRKHSPRHTSPRCQALRQTRSEKPRQEVLAPKERERQVAAGRFRLKANARALGSPALRPLPPGRKAGRSQAAATQLHVALHTNV